MWKIGVMVCPKIRHQRNWYRNRWQQLCELTIIAIRKLTSVEVCVCGGGGGGQEKESGPWYLRFTSVMDAMKCRFICEVFSLWTQFIFFVWRPQILHIPDSVPPPSIYYPLKGAEWKGTTCGRWDFGYLSVKRYRIVWFMLLYFLICMKRCKFIHIIIIIFFWGGGWLAG